ncbi:MAG: DUF4388 domain-containing protein [Acidobacteriota bacterium]|nr:DUF4388 domain-containing protein [Acidobacteriota bacterium]
MTQVLRGRIEPLGLVDVLAYLGRTNASGALNVEQGSVKKAIIISDGMIVFARSNQVQDRLGDILLAKGLISQAQYDQGTALIYEKGFRHGRALVEIGAISPKVLWDTIQEQVKTIAGSIIPWEAGNFEFINKDLKRKEAITLKWSILDMVQDIIRNLDNAKMFRNRFGSLDVVYRLSGNQAPEGIGLEPYEEYILNFIDGETSLKNICTQSDYGEAESLRVIYLLKSLGWIEEIEGAPVPEAEPDEVHPLVRGFNEIFSFLHGYIAERVGTVGTNLLRKFYEDVRQSHHTILLDVNIMDDGRLNPGRLQANLDRLDMSDGDKEMVLDEAMNEYLNVGILAVKKVLGTEHEAMVVSKIGELFEG